MSMNITERKFISRVLRFLALINALNNYCSLNRTRLLVYISS